MQDKGLGDSLERITKITGVKSIVEATARIFNKDCGCDERRDLLNKWFPYKSPMGWENGGDVTRLNDENFDEQLKDMKRRFPNV